MENVLRNFLKSDKHTLSVCGMAHVALHECLPTIKQIIEESGRECVVLSPNSRLIYEGESIYSHLFSPPPQDNEDIDSEPSENENFELKCSEQQKTLPNIYPLRINTDNETCVYLLDNAHLLSDTKFVDFFRFTNLERSQRKVIFLGDPYQIQRCKDLLSQCDEVFKLSLPEPNTLNSAQLKNAARLAWAIEKQQFAAFDLAVDHNLLVQNDNALAAQQLVSDYQEEPSVWYLAETHFHTHRLNQWLRPKLLQKTNVKPLESGDRVEIYVWPHKMECPLFENKVIIPSGNLEIIKEAMKPEKCSQDLNGRAQPILFHLLNCTLTREESNQILQEFLEAEKPELDTDTAISVQAWGKNPNNKHNNAIAYVRYGYAATVHHAQGMKRNTVYM